MSRFTGFVVRLDHAGPRPFESFERRGGRGDAGLVAERFAVYSRPFRASSDAAPSQPVVTAATILVYAGWVADPAAVARRLGRPELEGACDAALLAAAWERWGASFPAEVEGEYTFALIDRKSGEAVAARDALGTRKLFWYQSADQTWIGSNLALLLAFLPRAPALDPARVREGILGNLLFGASESTLYAGMRYLPPAHVFRFGKSGGAPRGERYWHPETLPPLDAREEREYDEHFRAVLKTGVRQALRAPGPVLAELSGGLDSSTVVSVAARLCREEGTADKLQTLSFVSADRDWDDAAFRRAVYEPYGLVNHTYDCDAEPPAADLVGHSQPSIGSIQGWMSRGRHWAARELGARVCLTGQGGDLVFCKHQAPQFVADLWRQGQWRQWFAALWSFPDGYHGRSFWDLLRFSFERRFRPPAARVPYWLRGGIEVFVPPPPLPRIYDLPARQFYLENIVALACAIPDDADGGLEPRHPLLARPMLEFGLRLPWQHLKRPGEDRVIQLRALKDILPESVRRRRSKADFTAQAVRSLRSLARASRAHGFRRLAELDLIDRPAFAATVDRFLHGLSTETMLHVASALVMDAWLEANGGAPTFAAGSVSSLAAWAAAPSATPELERVPRVA